MEFSVLLLYMILMKFDKQVFRFLFIFYHLINFLSIWEILALGNVRQTTTKRQQRKTMGEILVGAHFSILFDVLRYQTQNYSGGSEWTGTD